MQLFVNDVDSHEMVAGHLMGDVSVDRYFRDDPNLSDVFCYSTDYPHVEGTKNSMQNMLAKVEPLGEEITKKFFRTNAEWLLP